MAKKKTTKKSNVKTISRKDLRRLVSGADKDKEIGLPSKNLTSPVGDCLSTGSLVLDLALGGGWAPGRVIDLFGPEGSGKSTICYASIREALDSGIMTILYDHEGSHDRIYMEKIGVDWQKHHVDIKGSTGLLHIKQPDFGEQAFKHMRKILRGMPSKDSGAPSILFVVDSFAAMMPKSEDDDKSGLGAHARMFSQCFRWVKTRLADKRAILLGTNQIRHKIGGYGNPETEPGGFALKHNTDQRVKVSRFSKQIPANKKVTGLGIGGIEEEQHVSGDGTDRYMYAHAVVQKNKAFSPFKTCEFRLWYEEQGLSGRGIDPVYDCFYYLQQTGQVDSGRGYYTISVEGFEGKYTWKRFKSEILRPGFDQTITLKHKGHQIGFEVYDGRLKDKDEHTLVSVCKDQIHTGSAFRLRKETESSGKVAADNFIWGEVKKIMVSKDKKTLTLVVLTEDGTTLRIPKTRLTRKKARKMVGKSVKVFADEETLELL